MRYLPIILSITFLAPCLAQEAEKPADDLVELPLGRRLDALIVPATSTHPATAPKNFSLIVSSDRIQPIDPFGNGGVASFSQGTLGLGAQVDSSKWHLDFTAQLMQRSIRQHRIATTVDYLFASVGSGRIGIELTYWELGFRQRSFAVDTVEIVTEREGRTEMGGVVYRFPGPIHTEITLSNTAGWYTNRYSSVISAATRVTAERLSNDDAAIGGTRLTIRGPLNANRISLSGSIRYLRLYGLHSAWIPQSEWSGDIILDIRAVPVRKKAIYVGVLARFGPSSPGLATDTTFGLRIRWKLR